MAEKEQQNVTASEPPGITAIRDVVDAHAGKLPEHGQGGNRKRSGGEVLFDRVVYTGIGFGVNEAASLWITDQFMHGKPKWYLGGKPFSKEGFDSAAGWIAKKFKMPKAKAGNTLLMATLLSGGTLLVLPMRWLEENKISWVQRANHMLDGWRGNKMSAEEAVIQDYDATGLSARGHPMKFLRERLKRHPRMRRFADLTTAEVKTYRHRSEVTIPGLSVVLQRPPTA
ncbi:MAG: hypothetical protein EBV03_09975, partial [Proteobacteria bacterium]|nr:hypothetical protein [Pseudomonadota bacterium]